MPIYRRANVLLARLSDSEILFHDVRYYTVAEISATSPARRTALQPISLLGNHEGRLDARRISPPKNYV